MGKPSTRNKAEDKKTEDKKTDDATKAADKPDTPIEDPKIPAIAKPGCVAFGSRFTRYRLTLAPGDNKTPPEVVEFHNGRVDINDKEIVKKMRAHPLLGNEFHELGAA